MIQSLLRTAVTCLALFMTAVFVAGCGGASTSSASTNKPITASTTTTLGQAAAFARAVNLRAGDLPASRWLVVGHESVLARAEHSDSLSMCEGRRASTGKVVRITSPILRLDRGGQLARTTVYVLPNAALARRELASARECVALLLARRTSGAPPAAYFAPLHASLPGVRVAELRLRFPPAGVIGTLYKDTLVFVVGHAEVALDATGIPHPFPAVIEQRLISLFYTRAEAHKL